MVPKVIYVMGPPGAGKGTQAELLAQKLNYHRFSTGDAFRTVSRQDTPLGRKVKETIDNGYLAPPEMAAEIVISAIKEHLSAGRGLIFDGTPRTVEEAAVVDDFFENSGYGKPLAIVLNLNKEEMIRRNSQRKFCLDVEGSFPILNEQDVNKCATIGGRIGTRPDDEPEKFGTRWDQYMEHTFPVIEKYRALKITKEIDGMQSIEKVYQQIINSIDLV